MPKVSDEHRAAMRARIQDAALACVRRKGLASTSMSDIIRESGLSAGAIYGYFGSKDELIAAMAAELITSRFDILERLAQQPTVPHPVLAILELLESIPAGMVEDGVVMQVWGIAPVDRSIAALTKEWIASFTTRLAAYLSRWLVQSGLAEAEAATRAEELSPAVIGLAQGYFVRGALGGPEELERYRASLRVVAELIHP